MAIVSCGDFSIVSDDNDESFFNDEEDCNCDKRYIVTRKDDYPENAEVIIRVSNNKGPVEIKIIKGTLESGEEIQKMETTRERNSFLLNVGTKYTYVAQYNRGDDVIMVPVYSDLSCNLQECMGVECYQITNNVIDLSLRF